MGKLAETGSRNTHRVAEEVEWNLWKTETETTQLQAGLIIYGAEGHGVCVVWSLKGSWPWPRALNVACLMRRGDVGDALSHGPKSHGTSRDCGASTKIHCPKPRPAIRSNHATTAATRRTEASLAPRRRSGRRRMSAGTDARGIVR